ncbi:MAG TPA: hypothetical protein VL442_18385 [Mucilaginibacter sp.]|jgi:hypothetical protein|nr:hypothetical protein [Mucilaginibacter sp.]
MRIDFRNNCIVYNNENWLHKKRTPLSTNFSEIEVLMDGRILVLEYDYKFQHQNLSNLYCLDRELEIDWFLPLPHPNFKDDFYVGFTSNGEKIFANTWYCFRVEVETETGSIKNVEFTK